MVKWFHLIAPRSAPQTMHKVNNILLKRHLVTALRIKEIYIFNQFEWLVYLNLRIDFFSGAIEAKRIHSNGQWFFRSQIQCVEYRHHTRLFLLYLCLTCKNHWMRLLHFKACPSTRKSICNWKRINRCTSCQSQTKYVFEFGFYDCQSNWVGEKTTYLILKKRILLHRVLCIWLHVHCSLCSENCSKLNWTVIDNET